MEEWGGTASLDRIDGARGYVEGNVWWVHKDVNVMKMDLEVDYFVDLREGIARNDTKPGEQSCLKLPS